MMKRDGHIDTKVLQGILVPHVRLYSTIEPHYQAKMLESILGLWDGHHTCLLDVGCGTGVIAQAMAELFPVESVEAIDVVDRFCPTVTVRTRCYDGKNIPFAAAKFDAATLNNVLHHVPIVDRPGLLREIKRVVDGPLYIKDHVCSSVLDRVRLVALDAWGNIPFGGMIKANYLTFVEWESLAELAGYKIGAIADSIPYRSGLAALCFPNRLEVTMRFDPI